MACRWGRSSACTDRLTAISTQGIRRWRACPVPRHSSTGSGFQPVIPDQVIVLAPPAIHTEGDRAHRVDGVLLAQLVTTGKLLHLAVQMIRAEFLERPVGSALQQGPQMVVRLPHSTIPPQGYCESAVAATTAV